MRMLLTGVSLLALAATAALAADPAKMTISTGQTITPTAAHGSVFAPLNPNIPSEPTYTVGQAETELVSPDGKTMLILTSGYNLNATPTGATDPLTSTEFVFVFDISSATPVQKQALPVPNAFSGIAWAPNSQSFYVGGGQNDNVHIFTLGANGFAETGTPIALNDTADGVPQPSGLGLFSLPGFGVATTPLNGGMAVTADGSTLIVAELENDQLNDVNLATGAVTTQKLRPGDLNAAQAGVPGGEFPYWVAVTAQNIIYVSSERDREIDVVDMAAGTVTKRIKVAGNPNRMVLNKAQTKLFVTADNADMLYVIDTATNKITGQVRTTAPIDYITGPSNGASPNSVALSPDETTAYVTNAAMNAVAVIDITGAQPVVTGLIPTGWEPTSVATSADGTMMYIINAESLTGPNPLYPTASANQYDWQLSKAGFLTLPTPSAADLIGLTSIVSSNDHFNLKLSATDLATVGFLRTHIRHIVYIVKENRTYDQILGDLGRGNGDPSLAMYGRKLTPNFHNISKQFVDLDNYYDPSLCSMDGWQFSTAGRVQDLNKKVNAVNYGKGGGSYDSEGLSRDVNVGLATGAERLKALPLYGVEAAHDPNLLPGTANEVAPDGPGGEQGAGFIWDAAIRAGLSIRNYGFLLDLVPYEAPAEFGGLPVLRDPHATKTVVAFPATFTFQGRTDPYFRGFDNNLPDFYRYQEWAREFDGFVKDGQLPAFETVRFMHDHTGNFSTAIDGVNTPELQQADNDYAVGLLVDKIAHSPYASSTLVFVTEDDSQDGPDHVDTHRSTGYIVGPYVKQGAVVSTRYSTVSMLRTMGDILGLEHLDVQIAGTKPMTDVFDTNQASWTYSAVPAQVLLTNTQLPILNKSALLKHASLQDAAPLRHDAAWWAAMTKQFRFDREDLNDENAYNRVLWLGTMGDVPYPVKD
jgi:DNA-binding beta-propeller fold protein YncE